MPHQRIVILVLGMHRSGTSALTRTLALCGAALPTTLMAPAAEDNATGFWEPEPLVDLHDAALAAMGASWSDLRTLPSAWFASGEADDFRRHIADRLDQQYGAAPLFVVKDPRLCRLMPLWRPMLEARSIDPRIVIPIRHPLDVAASLHRRESFDPPRSLQLWLSHVLAAERDTRDLPRCFVTYDQLLADPHDTLARIAARLALTWPTPLHEAAPAITEFLSPDWRHHATQATRLDDLPALVAETYRWMLEAASAEMPPATTLDAVTQTLTTAQATLGPAIGALQAEITRKAAETKHWVDAAVERYAIIEAQQARLQALESRPIPRDLMHRLRQWARPKAK